MHNLSTAACHLDEADLVLERFCYADDGTFGRLSLPSGQTLYTVERPWLGNAPRVSCVPEGRYACAPRRYNRGGYEAVHIKDVPGRDYILFHVANWPTDVMGCVGVGESFGVVGGRLGVASSKRAFAAFMEHFGGWEWTLEIRAYRPKGMVRTASTMHRRAA